jgi:hypothetical protein
MGHGRGIYFWIAISPLPGNPQFLPLDKIFPSLKKYAFLRMCRCKCGFVCVALNVWRGRPRPRVGEHLHRSSSDRQLACPFQGLCTDVEK